MIECLYEIFEIQTNDETTELIPDRGSKFSFMMLAAIISQTALTKNTTNTDDDKNDINETWADRASILTEMHNLIEFW